MKLEYNPYILEFKFDAGTSRGVMKQRKVWFLKITSYSGLTGQGEVAPLERLSDEYLEDVEERLKVLSHNFPLEEIPENREQCFEIAEKYASGIASIRFGLEMALIDLMNESKGIWFDNSFTRGEQEIKINGLIWMGHPEFMKKQIDEKLAQGFDCIKIKVGAIDFKEELKVIGYLREKGPDVEIRLDANGAFKTSEVLSKLNTLSEYGIHSIEQPIIPKQPEAMSLVCEKSPIPIALDEELIGITDKMEKRKLLEGLKPDYIILKPSLLGGFFATHEWIQLAESLSIGWWLTSALESNLGLNAIAQFAAEYQIQLPQGLGTGQLFTNNLPESCNTHGQYLRFILD